VGYQRRGNKLNIGRKCSRASPGDPKNIYFVEVPLESQNVIGQKPMGLKSLWDSNLSGKNFKNFSIPD